MAPRHTGIWAQTLVEALRKRGISDQTIVGNAGINLRALEGDEPKIRFDDLALLFERAEEVTGDDLIGFNHAQGSDYRRGGLIAYTGISSPTVRTLLHNLARYQRISSDAIEISTNNLDEEGLIEWHFQVQRGVTRRQYVEFGGTGIVDIIRRLTNRRVTPLKVEFRHFRKANLKPIAQFFGCTVEYGSDENRIKLKQTDLDLPLRSADGQLYNLLRKFSEEALKKLSRDKPSIVVDVEERVAANPGKSQEDVAKELGMSTRTLSRRLTEAGTTYFGVVEAYREAMAKSMLTGTDMQFTEVAYVLGYADASTFSTAFKRWVGKTPSQYRDQNSE
ncbi:MAG: AraC family transcriptional regulator [Tateyamaria sp.]|uniref:AraC family transcriptional regulator n=1 Tax=Tateyamaria sp. TaxID=1929288 RepID=UPI00329F86D8